MSAAEGLVENLRTSIRDEELRARPLVGLIDQWTDNTDVLENPRMAALPMS